MELVYLWVEEYKNIKKQGFNFSPRFKCEYDEKTNELTIDENKEYVSIFPENINITAIVGENGSGKSSLGNFISYFYDNYNVYHSIDIKNFAKFLILYISKQNENFILSNIKGIYCKHKLNPFKSKKYFSNFIEISKENLHNKIAQSSSSINKSSIKYMRFSLKNFNYEDSFSKLLYDLGLKSYLLSNDEIKRIYKLCINQYNKFLCLILLDNIKTFDLEKLKTIKSIKKELKNLKIDIPSEEEFKYFTTNTIKIDSLHTLKIKKYINYFNFFFLNEKKVDIEELSNGEFIKFSIGLELNKYRNYRNKVFTLIFDEVENSLHPNWQKSYIKEVLQVIENFECSFHLIFITHSPFILSDLPKENIIFLDKIDENTKDKYPSINIEKLEKGNCLNVSKFININPFGANIHTLLSHGFFMKDGLMGEFAKEKIQSIIKYHEEILEKKLTKEENKKQRDEEKEKYEEELKKEFWQIQSIIGDDYLKQVIKNHLVEIEKILLGVDEAKQEEIKRLKAQIKLLEELKCLK
ncbi:AAA family ATPase [Malaciobacter marinus]|uniref:AAA family ATPase n=1 Tax=Malaciobacter marinus TaxID=505249 RepID=UPI003B002DC8